MGTLAVAAGLARVRSGPLLATPLHAKALTSAMGSWAKAYINWLPSPAEMSAAVGGSEGPGDAAAKKLVLLCINACLSYEIIAALGCHGGGVGEGTSAGVGREFDGWAPVHSSIQLVVLLWLSRAVWATGRLVLLMLDGPSSSTCTSISKIGESRDGNGEVVSSAAAVALAASPSSSSSSAFTATQSSGSSWSRTSDLGNSQSSSIAEHCTAGEGSSSCTSGGFSSTSGTETSTAITSSSNLGATNSRGSTTTSSSSSNNRSDGIDILDDSMRTAQSPGNSCSSSRCEDGVGVEDPFELHIDELLADCTKLALKLHKGLLQWQIRASEERPQPAHASAVSGNATAATPAAAAGGAEVCCNAEPAAVAAAGGAGVSSIGEPAAVAAAGGVGVSSTGEPAAAAGVLACDQVPKRFSRLPQHGLPEAVVKLLHRDSSMRVVDDLRKGVGLAWEGQQQYLREVVELCEVLQQEVPSPVGCNDPECVDFKGVSEITASCKTCLGCGVARYCSRKCQVGHWKVHKGACKRLQKESTN